MTLFVIAILIIVPIYLFHGSISRSIRNYENPITVKSSFKQANYSGNFSMYGPYCYAFPKINSNAIISDRNHNSSNIRTTEQLVGIVAYSYPALPTHEIAVDIWLYINGTITTNLVPTVLNINVTISGSGSSPYIQTPIYYGSGPDNLSLDNLSLQNPSTYGGFSKAAHNTLSFVNESSNHALYNFTLYGQFIVRLNKVRNTTESNVTLTATLQGMSSPVTTTTEFTLINTPGDHPGVRIPCPT